MVTRTPEQMPSTSEATRSSHRVARFGAPIALVGGSVLTAAGMALHLPAMPETEVVQAIAEAPTKWLVSHILLSIGLVLVALGAAAAVRLARGRGSALTLAGAITTSLGAMVMALSDIAHGAVSFAVVNQVDAATSLEIHEAYFSHPGILALNSGPLLITVGMLVLGAGLLRSRAIPRWAGIATLATPIAMQAGFALGFPTYVQGLPFVIGMTTLAYLLVSAQTSRPLTGDTVNEPRSA